jgi:S1-C subfamily serine protease
MGQYFRGFFEKLKRAFSLHAISLNGLSAPIIILILSAFAAVPRNVSAQSVASSVSQPASQSDLKTPQSEISRVQSSGGGYLGVYLGDVNEDRAKELKLKEIRGVVVGRVEEGSPAAKAGLRENDVILAFNQQRIHNSAHFHRLLIESRPGSEVSLGIIRGGSLKDVSATLGQRQAGFMDERSRLFADVNAMLASAEELRGQAEEARRRGDEKEALRLLEDEKYFRKEAEERRAYIEKQLREGTIQEAPTLRRPGYGVAANRYQIGVIVTPLTEQLAKFFDAPKGGVLITEVRAGEAGERAGLKAGDCIVSINGEAVTSAADLNRLVNQKSPGDLELVTVRDRNERRVKVKLDQK